MVSIFFPFTDSSFLVDGFPWEGIEIPFRHFSLPFRLTCLPLLYSCFLFGSDNTNSTVLLILLPLAWAAKAIWTIWLSSAHSQKTRAWRHIRPAPTTEQHGCQLKCTWVCNIRNNRELQRIVTVKYFSLSFWLVLIPQKKTTDISVN